jgi:hypothetical protein
MSISSTSKIWFALFNTKKNMFFRPNYGLKPDKFSKTPEYKFGDRKMAEAYCIAKPDSNLVVKEIKVTTVTEIL